MKRKITQQGPNTLGVSLPIRWIIKNGVKKGDEIEISEIDGKIIIGAEQKEMYTVNINIPTKEVLQDKKKHPYRYIVRTIVINVLRKGYAKINLIYDTPKVLPIINNCVNEVIGYEITHQDSGRCTIENVVKLIDTDLEKYLVKFRHIISNFSKLTYENIIENKENNDEIDSAFTNLEKNYNTLCRFIMNSCQEKTKEKIMLYDSIEHLYQAGRNMFYATKIKLDDKIELDKESLKYAKEVFHYIDDTFNFIASRNILKITDLNLSKNRLTYDEINRIMIIGKKCNPVLIQLCFVARRMWDSVGPFVGSVI